MSPDTSTTAYFVQVMTAVDGGAKAQRRKRMSMTWEPWTCNHCWDWVEYDYRITPEPKVQPWTMEIAEAKLGVRVRDTANKRYGWLHGVDANEVHFGIWSYPYDVALKQLEYRDAFGSWHQAGTVTGGQD